MRLLSFNAPLWRPCADVFPALPDSLLWYNIVAYLSLLALNLKFMRVGTLLALVSLGACFVLPMPGDITGETWERAPDTAVGYVDFECRVDNEEAGVKKGGSAPSIGRIFYPAVESAAGRSGKSRSSSSGATLAPPSSIIAALTLFLLSSSLGFALLSFCLSTLT